MTDRCPEKSAKVRDRRSAPGIFLVGFMGAGKTSVGRELARTLGWAFVDLDERIILREGRSIADIFRSDGEAQFRKMESRALAEVVAQAQSGVSTVIALGGGAYAQPANVEVIRSTDLPVVFLDASLDELRRRCATEAGIRPLFRDESQFSALYGSRRVHYLQAEVHIDTTSKSVEAVAAEIMRLLGIVR